MRKRDGGWWVRVGRVAVRYEGGLWDTQKQSTPAHSVNSGKI